MEQTKPNLVDIRIYWDLERKSLLQMWGWSHNLQHIQSLPLVL